MIQEITVEKLQDLFVDCIDFPIKDFIFPDITPLIETEPQLLKKIIDNIISKYKYQKPDVIACIESFGYIFGLPVSYALGTRIALIRKEGKLPRNGFSACYDMIYCKNRKLEINKDSIRSGDNVLIIDDFLASGGTIGASVKMIEQAGGIVRDISCVVEIIGADGRKKISRDLINYHILIDMKFDELKKKWKILKHRI